MYPLPGNRKDRAHTQERPYAETNTNPKTGQIYPRHSHGLMNVAPSRGAKGITLKRIHHIIIVYSRK